MTQKVFKRVVCTYITTTKMDYFLQYKYDKIWEYYGDNVLDFGTGKGGFANWLHSIGKNVTGVDIVDKRVYNNFSFSLYDGHIIPHKDNQFETVLCMFVLHHLNNQVEILKELLRVSSRFVIIAEDLVENFADKVLGSIHLNTSIWDKGVDSFHSDSEWKKIFKNLSSDCELIKVVYIPRYAYLWYPVPRAIYILEKKSRV